MTRRLRPVVLAAAVVVLALSCSSNGESASNTSAAPSSTASGSSRSATFTAEVWADNWFAFYVNGQLVGQDSEPITQERSFNAETIRFSATYPLTLAMVTKDYKQTDSGLEYIGTSRQQMGDGGFVAQVTDTGTGRVVATTGADWRGLVIQRAPTNKDCVRAADPDVACHSESTPEPDGWTGPAFDDSTWALATVYTAAEVGTKGGYDAIRWDPGASLIWTADLQADNTILWRYRVDPA